jgi:predicted ATPase
VQLFVDRAQTVRPDFQVTRQNAPAVAALCARLEGIPLAIELAASRAQVLTPKEMLSQLEHRFDFLVSRRRDAAARHRTLRAAIDWSFRLLSPELGRFFARLSVFRGGWTVEAAEAVCAEGMRDEGEGRREEGDDGVTNTSSLDLLAQLRECSLVLSEETGEAMCFRMLETLREYGQEKLAELGEVEQTRRRHCDWCLRLAAQAEPKLGSGEQGQWLARLEQEHDNLRAAHLWALENDPEADLRLLTSLARFWQVKGHWTEGREALERALERGAAAPPLLRAMAMTPAGTLASYQGDYAAARALFEENLAIRRELGSQRDIATLLNNLGGVARNQGDYAAARALYEEGLAIRREKGDKRGIATSLGNLGLVAYSEGDYASARTRFEESFAILRDLDDKWSIASSLGNLGLVADGQGDYASARALHEESLAIRREIGDKWGIATSLGNLGLVAYGQQDYTSARALLAEALALQRELGSRRNVAEWLEGLAWVTAAQGRTRAEADRSARLLGAAEALRDALGIPLLASQRADHERQSAVVRGELGDEAFTAAFARGRAMTWEQAAAYALEEDSP